MLHYFKFIFVHSNELTIAIEYETGEINQLCPFPKYL